MKILVTGANGYLGQGILKGLLDNGHEVVAADYSAEYIDYRAIIKECDLFSVSDPFEYFECPDAVLHLAWRNGFVHNALNHIEDMPLHYMFIKRLVDSGVKKISIMGSMHEIGFYEGSISEDTPCNPLSLYGIGKDALRKATRIMADENQVIFQWLRGFYIVGNSKRGCSIFSKITSAEKEGKEFFPFTSGKNQWDFIRYETFCEQVIATIEQDEVNGIINICSGHPEKLSDCVEKFIKENGYKIKLAYNTFPDRKYDSKAVWGNNNKIEVIMRRKYNGH